MKNRRIAACRRSRSRLAGQKGYLLLAVMLLIAVMLIAMTLEAPRIAQQIKREKEEELVHRGKEYAIAIRKFYRKTGTYPLSLEQLEDTNHVRFLRRRFKDPMTEDGKWKLIHVGEAQITIPTAGMPTGQTGTLTTSPPGSLTPSPSPTPGGFGTGFNPGGLLGSQPTPGGQMGTLQTQNIPASPSDSSQGGGPIIGVASTSNKTSIKEYNDANEYDQWLFVYDPRLEQVPGNNGVIVAAPRGASSSTTAVPAGVIQGAPGIQPAPGTQPVPLNPAPGTMATPTPRTMQ